MVVVAKQTALATQGVVACTKVLAPCVNSPLCQERVVEASRLVEAAVLKMVLTLQCDVKCNTHFATVTKAPVLKSKK